MVEAERVDVARWAKRYSTWVRPARSAWRLLIAALAALSEFSDPSSVAHFGGVLLAVRFAVLTFSLPYGECQCEGQPPFRPVL